MSFRCGICGKPQFPRTKPTKVVLEERRIVLSPVQKIGQDGYLIISSREIREIVKEVPACLSCSLATNEPQVVEEIDRSQDDSREDTEVSPGSSILLVVFCHCFFQTFF